MTNPVIDTDSLNISERWKTRFKLFDSLDAENQTREQILKSERFKSLDWKQRFAVNGNIWAFIGSFIYYFCKGMHQKGGVILALTFIWATLLTLVDFFSGFTLPDNLYWIVPSALCSMLANLDYYRKVKCNESMWHKMPAFFHIVRNVIVFAVIAFVIYVACWFFVANHQYATEAAAKNERHATRIRCGMNDVYVMPDELALLGKDMICQQLIAD